MSLSTPPDLDPLSIGQSHRWPAHRGPHLFNCFSRVRNALFKFHCHHPVPLEFTPQIRIVDGEKLRCKVPAVLGHRQRCPQYFLINTGECRLMPAKNPESYCLVFQQIICHCSSFLGTAERNISTSTNHISRVVQHFQVDHKFQHAAQHRQRDTLGLVRS